jgi:PAS domain S-box-containing protein
LDDVLRIAAQQAAALVGAHVAAASLSQDPDGFQIAVQAHFSEKLASWQAAERPSIAPDLCAEVYARNEPLRMSEAELAARPRSEGSGESPPLRGWLAAPLIARDGKNLGVLQLSDKFEGEFDEEDQAALVLFAQFVSTAVENARLNEAVSEREVSLQAVNDLLPACIAYIDREQRFRSVNRTYVQWFGLVPDQIIGSTIRDLLGEEAYESRRKYILRALTGEPTRSEGTLRLSDGRVLETETVYIPDVHQGEVRGFASMMRDVTEVRATQTAIRESESRYRHLADTVPVLVWTAEPNGALNFVNERWRQFFGRGFENGDVPGWVERVHPEERRKSEETWAKAIRTRKPFSIEYRLRRSDGAYRWHLCIANPTIIDGELRGWVGSMVDIEDQRAKERTLQVLTDITEATLELREPEKILGVILKKLCENLGASRAAFTEFDEDENRFQVVQDWSPGLPPLSGTFFLDDQSLELAEGQRKGAIAVVSDVAADPRTADRIDAYEATHVKAFICCPLVKGRLVSQLAVHQDAPRQWTESEVELVRMVADRGWSSIARARAERVLQQSEQRLRRVLEAATVGVVVNDENGVLLYANQRLLDMLGYSVEELRAGAIRWSMIETPRGPDQERAVAQLNSTARCDPLEMTLVAKNGEQIPVYVGAAVIPNDEGRDLFGAVFLSDLRDQKKVEQELKRLNAELNDRVRERTAELEAANAEMEGFTYTVAHDLRSPLRAIVATARILLEEAGEGVAPEFRGLLMRQAENAKRLAQLIDDLLSYSRLSKQVVERKPVDVTELAEGVAEAVREERGNPVVVQPGMRAKADPSLLRLVLFNLIDNASKFSPKGTSVKVGQENSTFFVRDEGVGFDMVHAHKLFEPFERLVRQDEFAGTGIGLANVKRIVERHGGTVWAESSPGKGATFWFTLG